MTLRTAGPSGLRKAEQLTTKFSQARTLVSTRHHHDSTTTRSSTGRASNSTFPDPDNIDMVIMLNWTILRSRRTKSEPQLKHGQALSSSRVRRHWGATWLSSTHRSDDSSSRDCRAISSSRERLERWVQAPMETWRILWWRRASIWAWSTVTSFEVKTLIKLTGLYFLVICN